MCGCGRYCVHTYTRMPRSPPWLVVWRWSSAVLTGCVTLGGLASFPWPPLQSGRTCRWLPSSLGDLFPLSGLLQHHCFASVSFLFCFVQGHTPYCSSWKRLRENCNMGWAFLLLNCALYFLVVLLTVSQFQINLKPFLCLTWLFILYLASNSWDSTFANFNSVPIFPLMCMSVLFYYPSEILSENSLSGDSYFSYQSGQYPSFWDNIPML